MHVCIKINRYIYIYEYTIGDEPITSPQESAGGTKLQLHHSGTVRGGVAAVVSLAHKGNISPRR